MSNVNEEVCPSPLEIDEERKLAIFWDIHEATEYAGCLMRKDGKYHSVREETIAIALFPPMLPPGIIRELSRRPIVQYTVSLRGIKPEHLMKMLARARAKRKTVRY